MTLGIFLVRRLLRLVISLFAATLITFGLLHLAPGSFADIEAAGLSSGLSAAQMSQAQKYGSGVSFLVQYKTWLTSALHGDLGISYKYDEPVTHVIAQAFPVSAGLALLAMALALAVAIPLGILSASRRNSFWDILARVVTTMCAALPNYLGGLLLMLILSVVLRILPTSGWTGPQSAILPIVAIALSPLGILTRYARSSALEVLDEDYVLASTARGARRRTVMSRHVLRNSLIPLITVVGPTLAALMAGTIFVERLFGIPGLGMYFATAAQTRDMPLLMGATSLFALLLIGMNVVVDLSYAAIDPRTRVGLGLTSTRRRGQAVISTALSDGGVAASVAAGVDPAGRPMISDRIGYAEGEDVR